MEKLRFKVNHPRRRRRQRVPMIDVHPDHYGRRPSEETMSARLILAAALCLVTATGATAQPPDKQADASPQRKLKALLVARAATAQAAFKEMKVAWDASTVTTFNVLAASNKLVEAELAAATSPDEEIQALRGSLKRLRHLEKQVKYLVDWGIEHGLSRKDVLSAKRERESAEIQLLEAQIKAARAKR